MLNSHQNLSAGRLFYMRSQSESANTTYHPIKSLRLLDARGERISETLTDQQLTEVIYPTTDFPSDTPRVSNLRHYFLPFGVSLYSAIGPNPSSVTGSYYLDSKDKLEVVFDTAATFVNSGNVVCNIVSFAYASLRISNGQARVVSS